MGEFRARCQPECQLPASRMADKGDAIEIQRKLLGQGPQVVGSRADINECSRPSATRVAQAPIFKRPGCDAHLRKSRAEMTDVIEIMLGFPATAVNDDSYRVR